MEVAPGIYRITVAEERSPGLFAPNSYLVVGGRAAAFVDTGHNIPEHIQARLNYWRGIGAPKADYIFLTHRHRDHVGGASAISAATGAPIVTSEVEQAPIDQALLDGARVGRVARDGEAFDLGGVTLETVCAPGHTMGSLCVFHRQQRALFTGDNVLGSGSTVIHPHEGDIALYIQSLERLGGYGAQVIYPGHGAPVRDPQAKLRELVAHRLEREQQVLDCLRHGKDTVEAIFGELYPELEGRLHNMAREQVRSHLAKLVREGKVAASADGASYAIM